MRFAVTGVRGFVGSALVHWLSERGHEVFLLTRKDCDDILQDQSLNIAKMKALTRCDVLVHLAAVLETRDTGFLDSDHIKRVNIELPEKLAKLAIRSGIKKFFFVSTAKVFELKKNHNKGVGIAKTSPVIDYYASSKLAAENRLKKIFNYQNNILVIVRPPLIYGPGVKGNFKALIRLAQSGLPIPFSSLKVERSYLAIDNFCDFILATAKFNEGLKLRSQVFSIADAESYTIAEVLYKISRACNKEPIIFPFPVRLLEAGASVFLNKGQRNSLFNSMVLDIGLASRLVDWSPIVTMEQQLKKMCFDQKF